MSFISEWERAKSRALSDQQVKMNLAGEDLDGNANRGVVEPGAGKGYKTLVVDSAEMNKRANSANTTRANFGKAGKEVQDATEKIPKTLPGFASASAFTVFSRRWSGQLKNIDSFFSSKIVDPLKKGALSFASTEEGEAKKYR